METGPYLHHGAKSYVIALMSQGEVLMKWGAWMVFLLGGGTVGAWLITFFTRNGELLLKVDSILWQGCVFLYFTCWIAGVNRDKDIQKGVYVAAPEHLKVKYPAMICAIVIFGLFALMFLSAASGVYNGDASPPFPLSLLGKIRPIYSAISFIFLLNCLWVANVPIWRYYVRKFINPLEHDSATLYRANKDFIGVEKVRVISEYIKGNWQWYRFAIGGLFLGACDAVVLWSWYMSYDVTFAVSLSLAGFIIITECWIWSMRLRVDHSIAYIDKIARHYDLVPHRRRHG